MNQPEPVTSDARPGAISGTALKVGRYALALGALALLGWGLLAPMDEGVPSSGMVTVDTKRRAVQHQQGGIVRQVHVKEGSRVREGDVLMELEQASTVASYESIRQHYLALRSAESRLLAEQAGLAEIRFHPDIEAMKADPLVRQHLDTQTQLLRSRRMSLQAGLGALQENRAGLLQQRKGLERVMSERQRQLQLIEEELEGVRELVREGYAPRNRQREIERTRADIHSALAESSAAVLRIDHQVLELNQRMQLLQQDFRKEVDAQLADIRREVQADAEKLAAVTQDLARTRLRAPATGQVVGLLVQSVGAVITPGQKVMDIVPAEAPLLIEARVTPQVIDRIEEGQATDIRFAAFAHTPQLTVPGRVVSVSRDLLTDPDSRQSFYLLRVEITPQGRQVLGSRELQPGMMADVLIKTGERSFLTYLTYPLVRRIAQSMREE